MANAPTEASFRPNAMADSGGVHAATSKAHLVAPTPGRFTGRFFVFSVFLTAVVTYHVTAWLHQWPNLGAHPARAPAYLNGKDLDLAGSYAGSVAGSVQFPSVAGGGPSGAEQKRHHWFGERPDSQGPATHESADTPAAPEFSANIDDVDISDAEQEQAASHDGPPGDASAAQPSQASAADSQSPDLPFEHDPMLTRQLCVSAGDESELCIYDGPLCYDGESLFVVVADGSTTPTPVNPRDILAVERQRHAAHGPASNAAGDAATAAGNASAVGLRDHAGSNPILAAAPWFKSKGSAAGSPQSANSVRVAAAATSGVGRGTAFTTASIPGAFNGNVPRISTEALIFDTSSHPAFAGGGIDAATGAGGITAGYDGSARQSGPCLDWRTSQSVEQCAYGSVPYRAHPQAASQCGVYGADVTGPGMADPLYAQACADTIITTPVTGRAWGPDAKAIRMREVKRADFVTRNHIYGLHMTDPTLQDEAELVPKSKGWGRGLRETDTADVSPGSEAGQAAQTSDEPRSSSTPIAAASSASMPGPRGRMLANGVGDRSALKPEYDASGNPIIKPKPLSAVWLDGAMWFTPMMQGWWGHPWHAATAVFPLWHAKRHNASVVHVPREAAGFRTFADNAARGGASKVIDLIRMGPGMQDRTGRRKRKGSTPSARDRDGQPLQQPAPSEPAPRQAGHAIHSQPLYQSASASSSRETSSSPLDYDEADPRHGLRITTGGVQHPPMDYVVWHSGGDPRNREGHKHLNHWVQGVWPLLTQPQSTLLTRTRLKRDLELSDDNWVCANRAVVTGVQSRLFAGIADASAFRSQAWALAGVNMGTQLAFGRHPPRSITVIGRPNSRALTPMREIRRMIEATGG